VGLNMLRCRKLFSDNLLVNLPMMHWINKSETFLEKGLKPTP